MLTRLGVVTLAVASLSFCTAEPEAEEVEAASDPGDFVVHASPTDAVEVEALPLEDPSGPTSAPPPAAAPASDDSEE